MTTDTTTTSSTASTDQGGEPALDAAAAVTALVDRHLAAYCDPDTVSRTATVTAIWQPDGRLVDPPFEAAGHDAIVGITDAVLGHYPGHAFRRTTAVDAHHAHARYGWVLEGPDGTAAVAGTDVVTVVDGRLALVVGFFGDLS